MQASRDELPFNKVNNFFSFYLAYTFISTLCKTSFSQHSAIIKFIFFRTYIICYNENVSLQVYEAQSTRIFYNNNIICLNKSCHKFLYQIHCCVEFVDKFFVFTFYMCFCVFTFSYFTFVSFSAKLLWFCVVKQCSDYYCNYCIFDLKII